MVAITKIVDFQDKRSDETSDTIIDHRNNIKHDKLPIHRYRKQILHILRNFKRTVIFIGETGSGKSTQIPQFCHEVDLANNGLIAITQPRRVAARTLAERVSFEMGSEVGQLIGYKFRFETKVSKVTKIIYQTEGILLREALNDVKLRRYSIVIMDEVHERTVNTDVLLHVLKQAQKERKRANENPLRLILMSATMDLSRLYEYLQHPEIYYLRGRQHTVKLFYGNFLKASENDYLFNAISTVLQLHETEPKDHGFLVFLTGQEEIDTAIRVIRKMRKVEKISNDDIVSLALYASVPQHQQKNIFDAVIEGKRKVVFATNIAETSITIPGIHVIIDSGKVKRRSYFAKNRMEVLKVENISKAQAIQRAGRAGRDAPGKCYRLYSQQDYDAFEPVQTPELLRSNIASVLLNLISLGLGRLNGLTKLLDPPDNFQLASAIEELILLKAIELHQMNDLTVSVTDEGEQLIHFPIEPAHAKILLSASNLGCLEEALTIVAFLSSEPVFKQCNQDLFCKLEDGTYGQEEASTSATMLAKLNTNDGDHVRLLKVYNAYTSTRNLKAGEMQSFFKNFGIIENRLEKVCQIRKQLHQLCREAKLHFQSCGTDHRTLRHAIFKGLFQNACIYDPATKNYMLQRDTKLRVRIHPSSCMVNQIMQAFVFTELVHTNEVYARDICPIQKEWIRENDAQTSSKNSTIGHKLSELDRVRQMQLVRSSPCSSISSSSSSSIRRRKRASKLKRIANNEEKDEEMEVDENEPGMKKKNAEEEENTQKWQKSKRDASKNGYKVKETVEGRNCGQAERAIGRNERPRQGNDIMKKTLKQPFKKLVSYDVSSSSEDEEERLLK